MQFQSVQFEKAFATLTNEDQQVAETYYHTRSPTRCVRELGRDCSPKTMGKTLQRIARRCGAQSIKDLFAPVDNGKPATTAQLMGLLEKQGYKCALTGMVLTPETASPDHVEPVSCGGSHAPQNLQWVHTTINKMKSTLTQTEFVEFCSKVTAHTHTPV